MKKAILTISILMSALSALSQASVQWDYFGRSDFRNHDKEVCGNGSMQRVKARVNVPLSVKIDQWNAPRVWNVTLSATQAWLDNDGMAVDLNPERIINANVSLSHIRNISEYWTLIASAGVGIYAPDNYVRWSSVLANAGAIFAYRLSDNLSIGLGVGLTNSYGAPMIMPMGYIDWRVRGKVNVSLNISNGVMAKVSINATPWLTVDLAPIEFDGMSAVVRKDDKDKLYSMFMIRSTASLNFNVSRKFSIFAGGGGVLLRNSSIKERKIGSLFGGDDKDKYRFKTAPQIVCGLRYKF